MAWPPGGARPARGGRAHSGRAAGPWMATNEQAGIQVAAGASRILDGQRALPAALCTAIASDRLIVDETDIGQRDVGIRAHEQAAAEAGSAAAAILPGAARGGGFHDAQILDRDVAAQYLQAAAAQDGIGHALVATINRQLEVLIQCDRIDGARALDAACKLNFKCARRRLIDGLDILIQSGEVGYSIRRH